MEDHDDEPKIYLLPNLMTAGNLLCGFLAVLTIFKGMQAIDLVAAKPFYERAMFYIFGACLFDLLDGRLARLGGQESPFGQEFDSLADMVSFGIAPAMLVSRAVLSDLEWPNALDPGGSGIHLPSLWSGAFGPFQLPRSHWEWGTGLPGNSNSDGSRLCRFPHLSDYQHC